MDCCICISFAISYGLVNMLLFWLAMQLNGGVLKFLNILLFIFGGLISYSFLYLDMAILMHSLVYLVMIFLACVFGVLASVAKSFIHPFLNGSSFGGGSILM